MTTNQSAQIVKNPNTKKALTILRRFAALEAQYKEAEAQAKEASDQIKQAMIDAGVPKIEIDMPHFTGYITLAERTSYKAEDIGEVPAEFIKQALDTTKVKAQATLTGELPAGVVETKTQYITKKFKVVE